MEFMSEKSKWEKLITSIHLVIILLTNPIMVYDIELRQNLSLNESWIIVMDSDLVRTSSKYFSMCEWKGCFLPISQFH